jgi:hypothetical protein
MKKTILSTLVLVTMVLCSSFASAKPNRNPDPITSLVVNANVTVVLVTNPGQDLELDGDPVFMSGITIKQTEGRLVVDGDRKRNFKGHGIIYVPAKDLQQIKVNNAAFIRSSSALKTPLLRILVNSNCKFHISTLGKIDFVENDLYEVEYQVFQKPAITDAVVKTRE